MFKKVIISVGLLLNGGGFLWAQHQDVPEQPNIWRGGSKKTADSTSILGAFKGGTTHGHFRYMFMSTHNEGSMQDFAANAAGGGLRFESARYRGFSMGVSGFYIFNIGSHNLQNPDPATGMLSRYEIALFDITNPHNTEDMDRLEELFIQYSFRETELTFGKLLINTPFINLQDGRMRPTGVEGFYVRAREWENTTLEGGYIYSFSPRSTIRWYNTGESMGAHPSGRDVFGNNAQYAGNVNSRGVGIFGLHHRFNKKWALHIWDFYVDNVFNTAMIQMDYTSDEKSKNHWLAGFQAIGQHGVGTGGNADQLLSYVQADHQSYVFGLRVGKNFGRWKTSLNYNRITSHGRYQFPREWGREPFFSFIPRERAEGMGDVHASSIKLAYEHHKSPWVSSFSLGHMKRPDPHEAKLNKYGIPSYIHANLDFHYDHGGLLKGLETYILISTKIKATQKDLPAEFIMNRVNLLHTTLALNYHF
ncbi:MAG: OprD family outer membrane porin [Cryomorphaceae bacterium]|nr:OprD family outer membrane porin [Cryomorphaceae bacterium]